MVVGTKREQRSGVFGDGGPAMVTLKRGESKTRESGDEKLEKEEKKKRQIFGKIK